MVYPEKPTPKQTLQIGTGNAPGSREKNFRIGKHERNDSYWQQNMEEWVPSEHLNPEETLSNSNDSQHGASNTHDRKRTCLSSNQSEIADSVVLPNGFIHHQGFQGSPESQSTNLKYKFGKKKVVPTKDTCPPNTFKPKGFGSLYDELEFERRYKKVFDLNKHIHFVHSNFISGQRLHKRSKLPPIGHIPSVQSDPMDSRDIFAIMSVQRFNHPADSDNLNAPVTLPGQAGALDGFPTRRLHRRTVEIPQDLNVPIGFVPGTIKTTGNSPFEGVTGNMQKDGYRLLLASREGDSALGTLAEETSRADDLAGSQSERSVRTSISKKSKLIDNTKSRRSLKKKRLINKGENRSKTKQEERVTDDNSHISNRENTSEIELEPFNISVRVKIKPKDPNMNGGDDVDTERVRERRLPIIEQPESPVDDGIETQNEDPDKDMDKIMYPTELESDFSPRYSSESEDGLKVLRPTHIALSTDQYGIMSQKVQYPERFVLDESVAEEDEAEQETDENEHELDDNEHLSTNVNS